MASDPTIVSGVNNDNHFYYRSTDSQWRGILDINGTLHWEDANLRSELGNANARDLGEFASASDAFAGVQSETFDNYAFFDGAWYNLQGRELFNGKIWVSDLVNFRGTFVDGRVNIPKTKFE